MRPSYLEKSRALRFRIQYSILQRNNMISQTRIQINCSMFAYTRSKESEKVKEKPVARIVTCIMYTQYADTPVSYCVAQIFFIAYVFLCIVFALLILIEMDSMWQVVRLKQSRREHTGPRIRCLANRKGWVTLKPPN